MKLNSFQLFTHPLLLPTLVRLYDALPHMINLVLNHRAIVVSDTA
jgi:hypothetical protein